MKGKTQSGFNYDVNEKRLEDIRFFELLNDVDENPLKLPKLVEFVLGAEQKESLYEFLTKNDIVSVVDVNNAMVDIFNSVKEISDKAKNS